MNKKENLKKKWKKKINENMNEKINITAKIKAIVIFFVCISMTAPALPVYAKKSGDYWPKQSEKITSDAAILMEMDTGTILYQKNMEKKCYPASITKILTVLLALENSNLDEVVTFSQDAIYKTAGGSSIWRDIGEKMTMKECLYATMLESANECAYAVAEHVGGTYQAFIKMMNAKIKELGCTSSHFTNPHGLPDKKHYVSARDMAIIAKAAYENEVFRLICSTKSYVIPPTNKHREPTYLFNHHKMLNPKDTAIYLYDYCMGGKTGFTVSAGNTLVTYAQKGSMSLVAVILNGDSPQYWNETRALFDYGFDNFNVCNVAKYADTGGTNKTEKYDTLNANEPYARIDPQANVILPKTADFAKTEMEINYQNLDENVLAQLKYTYGKREIGTANIVRANGFDMQSGKNDTGGAGEADTKTAPGESADKNVGKPLDEDSEKSSKEQLANGSSQNEASASEPLSKETFSAQAIQSGIKQFFSDALDKAQNLVQSVSVKKVAITVAGIVGVILLLAIFRLVFHSSYVFRQRFADRKRRKRESRQYTIIRDTRKSKGRRRRKR